VRGLDFIFLYIYDVLCASSTEEKSICHIDVLLSRCDMYGAVINWSK